MKRKEFIGKMTYYKRLKSSVNCNPAFYGEFENETGETLKGRTASDASCAYGFLNHPEAQRKIEYHITKTGNIIFDYVDVINK